MKPEIEAFIDEPTNTVSYLLSDPDSGAAAIIDPVLNYDSAMAVVSTDSADAILDLAAEKQLKIEYVLETHAHADHLSAGSYLRSITGAKLAIGEHIADTQAIFGQRFAADDLKPKSADFDLLLADGATLPLGKLEIGVTHVPGHTPADVAYRVDDAVFVGDTLFMPDYGTARADFPGGDATALYRSIQRLLALPPETRMFMCHDYKAPGREKYRWETTVAEQRAHNVHVHEGVNEAEFVAMREARDATLSAPKLILPSIQVNIRGGRLPPQAANGETYLQLPLRLPEGSDALR